MISNLHSPYPCNIFTNTMNKGLVVVLSTVPIKLQLASLYLPHRALPSGIMQAWEHCCKTILQFSFHFPLCLAFLLPLFSPTRLFRYYLLPRVQVLPFLNNLTPPWFQNSLPPSPDSDSSSAVISSQTSDYSMDSGHFFEPHCPHL